MVVLLALVSALVAGCSDYLGGRAAVRNSSLVVTFWGQVVNVGLLPLWVLLVGWKQLHPGDITIGLIGGIAAGTAFIAFFHGLANGRMSVIAPLTALTTALVPVVIDVVGGTSLSPGRWIGVGLALVAIPLLAYHADPSPHSLSLAAEVTIAFGSGLGFAVFFVGMGHTSRDSGQWPVVFAAIGQVLIVGTICLVRRVPFERPPKLAVASGLCSVVGALTIITALQIGPIAIATVLGSMYPLSTTVLANRVDHEPVGRLNVTGIALAIASAACAAVYR